ncbi:MAG: AarF/UbiB family protein, partial [Actinomycetes bacterium]
MSRVLPTIDVKALLAEHGARLAEELDYTFEAGWATRFAHAWTDYPIRIPTVRYASESLLVTEWLDGTPLSTVMAQGAPGDRDRAGDLLARFAFWSPHRVGAIHADPHPGNFRLTPDGELGVMDFGSIGVGAGRFASLFAATLAEAAADRYDLVREEWVIAGMLDPAVTGEQLAGLLEVDTRLYTEPQFRFSRTWLSERAGSFREPTVTLAGMTRLRFPPTYLLEHRAIMGTLALMAGLEATVPMREVLDEVRGTGTPV